MRGRNGCAAEQMEFWFNCSEQTLSVVPVRLISMCLGTEPFFGRIKGGVYSTSDWRQLSHGLFRAL